MGEDWDLLQDEVDVGVDEGADEVSPGGLVHSCELGRVQYTGQGLLVVLTDVCCGTDCLVGLLLLSVVHVNRLTLRQWHLRSLHLLLMGDVLRVLVVLVLILVLMLVRKLLSSAWATSSLVALPVVVASWLLATRTRSSLHASSVERALLKLPSLSLLGELSQELEEGKQELALLRSEVIAQFLQLVHVLLDFFALLVSLELDLVDAFEHVSSALLTSLKLTDVEGAASERAL